MEYFRFILGVFENLNPLFLPDKLAPVSITHLNIKTQIADEDLVGVVHLIVEEVCEIFSFWLVAVHMDAQRAVQVSLRSLVLYPLGDLQVPVVSLDAHFNAKRKNLVLVKPHPGVVGSGGRAAGRAVAGSNALVEDVLVLVELRGDEALELVALLLLERGELFGILKPVFQGP